MTADALDLARRIAERVRPTIGPTFSSRGKTVEGRISEADFNALIAELERLHAALGKIASGAYTGPEIIAREALEKI